MSIVVPWQTVLTLPSVSIAVGQTRTSSPVAVPIGLTQARVQLDGNAWAPLTAISATVDLSDDGGTIWRQVGGINTSTENLIGGKCSVGVVLDAPNANSLARFRASITVNSGSAITLAGVVQVV